MTALAPHLTYAEFQHLDLPEGDTHIYELIKGEIVKRSSPNTPHQRTSFLLSTEFGIYNRQKKVGQFFTAPYDVYLDEYNAGIQPDLIFVSNERNFVIRENNGIVGAPDLVVEILSKGTMNKDRGDKMEVYEQFAIREYWAVDSQNRSIEVYQMQENRYRLFAFAADEAVVRSSVLPDFSMPANAIFED
jgi:Uma2 family endonuclease